MPGNFLQFSQITKIEYTVHASSYLYKINNTYCLIFISHQYYKYLIAILMYDILFYVWALLNSMFFRCNWGIVAGIFPRNSLRSVNKRHTDQLWACVYECRIIKFTYWSLISALPPVVTSHCFFRYYGFQYIPINWLPW